MKATTTTTTMYAPVAVDQFTYRFNKEHNTNIKKDDVDYADGACFVTIDFKDTPFQLIFQYTYELGKIQYYLAKNRESLLPLEDYPFPPEKDE